MLTIPDEVRFGTSSWAYEGWHGLVYKRSYPKSRFAKDCLAEYAAYEYQGLRIFRTAGIDHTFYRPPTSAQLAHYASQLPEGFRICAKVWEEITMPSLAAQHATLGRRFTAPFVVVRLLTPLGMSYADALKRAAPYTKLVEPLPRMRTETVELIRQAAAERRSIYVLANNRAEGNAPLTVQALVDLLRSTDALPPISVPPRQAR